MKTPQFGDNKIVQENKRIDRLIMAENDKTTIKQYKVCAKYTKTIIDNCERVWEIDAHTEEEAEELTNQAIYNLEEADCDELDIDNLNVIDVNYPLPDVHTLDMFDAKNKTT